MTQLFIKCMLFNKHILIYWGSYPLHNKHMCLISEVQNSISSTEREWQKLLQLTGVSPSVPEAVPGLASLQPSIALNLNRVHNRVDRQGWPVQTGTKTLCLYSHSPQACKPVHRAPTWPTTAWMEWNALHTILTPGAWQTLCQSQCPYWV